MLVGLVGLSLSSQANAQPEELSPSPTCKAPAGVESVPLPEGIPPPVARGLHDEFGEINPPNGRFQEGDVGAGIDNYRYAFMWRVGNRGIVVLEYGGIVYGIAIYAYELDRDGGLILLERVAATVPKKLCSKALSAIE